MIFLRISYTYFYFICNYFSINRYLNLQKSEDLRLLELARKKTPMLKQLNEELVNLQIQVCGILSNSILVYIV